MRSSSARCGVLVPAVVQGSKRGKARKGKQRRRKPKKQASEVRKGSAMPICRQGGCKDVATIIMEDPPRRVRVYGLVM